MGNQEGIGTLKLECPQMHPVGRILKGAPHQQVLYDPGAAYGDRRYWPDDDELNQFTTHCRQCDKPVGDATAALKARFSNLVASESESTEIATLQYL